jgi:hypothetical protein
MTQPDRPSARSRSKRPLLVALCVGVVAATLGGCYARAHTGAVVTAEYVPPRVETYPSYYYEGRVVYLVGDRWYYRDGPYWVYYASEPEVLVRRRVYVREQVGVHRAPPAHPRRHPPPRRHHHRDERRHEHRH